MLEAASYKLCDCVFNDIVLTYVNRKRNRRDIWSGLASRGGNRNMYGHIPVEWWWPQDPGFTRKYQHQLGVRLSEPELGLVSRSRLLAKHLTKGLDKTRCRHNSALGSIQACSFTVPLRSFFPPFPIHSKYLISQLHIFCNHAQWVSKNLNVVEDLWHITQH